MATMTAQATILIDGREMSGTVQPTTEYETVYSDLPEPDIGWSARDSRGHLHAYAEDGSRPTLKLVEGERWWCEDCNDEHAETWWACTICEERMNPGMKPPSMLGHTIAVGRSVAVEIQGEVVTSPVQIEYVLESGYRQVMVGEVVERTLQARELPLTRIVVIGEPATVAVR